MNIDAPEVPVEDLITDTAVPPVEEDLIEDTTNPENGILADTGAQVGGIAAAVTALVALGLALLPGSSNKAGPATVKAGS